MFGVPMSSIAVLLGFAVFGWAAHVLMKVGEQREIDPTVTMKSYFGRNPYRSIAKLLTVLLAVVGMAEPQITPLVAVGAAGIGYTADSAANHLMK